MSSRGAAGLGGEVGGNTERMMEIAGQMGIRGYLTMAKALPFYRDGRADFD